MQFQVPQFIETEDKIVGPLSLRQFMYVAAGVGVSGITYFVLQTWIWAIISVISIGSALAISFVKIEGRPLIKVIEAALNFYWKPQTYIWQPEHQIVTRQERPHEEKRPMIEKIAQGMALHKNWEDLQVGKKMSANQFTEQKMYGRYEIFQKLEGDRRAARRVDYR